MRRSFMVFGAMAALTATVGVGCETTGARQPYPEDPLLSNKKPVARKEAGQPQLVARTEPDVPSLPPTALAGYQKPPEVPMKPDLAKAALPAPAPEINKESNLPALAASEDHPHAGVPGKLVLQRKAPGTYGHAPDYAWLQGILEKRFDGQMELRFCDPSIEDRWGGKVELQPDPRLQAFHEGDLILVEGDLIADAPGAPRDPWRFHPRYRIAQVMIVPPTP